MCLAVRKSGSETASEAQIAAWLRRQHRKRTGVLLQKQKAKPINMYLPADIIMPGK